MEYRVATGWKIFVYIFAAALLASGIYLTVRPFIDVKHQYFLCVIGLALIFIAYYVYREVTVSKVTLSEDEIIVTNSFSTKSLSMEYIKGYRRGEKDALLIVAKDESAKPLQISSYFENYKEIRAWVQDHLQDVDAVAIEQETKEILADENFGSSVDEREHNLKSARKVTSLINGAAIVACLWCFIYPTPYKILMSLLLALPFLAFGIAWRFKGLVKLADNKKTAYPSIILTVMLPSLGLLIRALIDYDLYLYSPLLKPALLILIVVSLAWFTLCKDAINLTANKTGVIITLIGLTACYAYGATVFINGYYDNSKAQVFSVQVKDKHISSGKHTTYYLTVEQWGRYNNDEDLSVSKKLYQSINVSDTVHVYLQQGKLNVPWFYVRRY